MTLAETSLQPSWLAFPPYVQQSNQQLAGHNPDPTFSYISSSGQEEVSS